MGTAKLDFHRKKLLTWGVQSFRGDRSGDDETDNLKESGHSSGLLSTGRGLAEFLKAEDTPSQPEPWFMQKVRGGSPGMGSRHAHR